ncbi:hypothetical protein RRG08_037421 [Elysia crispata]|uniref:Uncharacterized protein n=1 Tax=Elysia crispata TaxID=231223 RepID=A0AAE1AH25_9GAST|nr:hypothetical protein RRG08_037421 [Elysia crispata]
MARKARSPLCGTARLVAFGAVTRAARLAKLVARSAARRVAFGAVTRAARLAKLVARSAARRCYWLLVRSLELQSS